MKPILYLGLEVPDRFKDAYVIHFPIIHIVPRPREHPEIRNVFEDLDMFTHIIFSSKSAVDIFFNLAEGYQISREAIRQKCLIAVGQSTALRMCLCGADSSYIASTETAEGIIELLERKMDSSACVLWPRSALARPLLKEWMQEKGVKFRDCIFYDTISQIPGPLPELDRCSEIVFTSPSTVDAFVEIFGSIPTNILLTCIGPITQKRLEALKTRRYPGS